MPASFDRVSRRRVLAFAGAATLPLAQGAGGLHVSVFRCDITPPIGGTLFNSVAARSIADPLFAQGVVLLEAGQPIVIAALDWCEIRNAAYDRWRSILAKAAGTIRERVLLSCVHQHDAPYIDTGAQRMLDEHKAPGRLCDPEFNEQALARVAAAVKESLRNPQAITHLGAGQAKVERVASNRRYVTEDGKVSYGRTSATRDPLVRNKPEGLIDPWLKTISFWAGDRPVAALNCYSTHPMSYYGKGDVSADFVGMARARRQQEMPDVAQIYLSGCSGDTMAGRYNDGNTANRAILGGQLYQGMADAWKQTKRHAVNSAAVRFRNVKMTLAPRASKGFSPAELRATLAGRAASPRARTDAALGLSWLARIDQPIDVPAIDFGAAQIVLMPAEAFVQYQLWAQELRPDSMVMVPGFGECAPGYIPTAKDAADGYDDHYSWIAFPECEAAMRKALAAALTR